MLFGVHPLTETNGEIDIRRLDCDRAPGMEWREKMRSDFSRVCEIGKMCQIP